MTQMSLYEFTDPMNYLLPKTESPGFLRQSKNIRTADATDTMRRLSEKPEAKKPKHIL
jgi:hypothetical protein